MIAETLKFGERSPLSDDPSDNEDLPDDMMNTSFDLHGPDRRLQNWEEKNNNLLLEILSAFRALKTPRGQRLSVGMMVYLRREYLSLNPNTGVEPPLINVHTLSAAHYHYGACGGEDECRVIATIKNLSHWRVTADNVKEVARIIEVLVKQWQFFKKDCCTVDSFVSATYAIVTQVMEKVAEAKMDVKAQLLLKVRLLPLAEEWFELLAKSTAVSTSSSLLPYQRCCQYSTTNTG